jgi:hypothetical protein
MKNAGHYLLLCVLLNSAAWGQAARPVRLSVEMRCNGLSCEAAKRLRSAPSVKLGVFGPNTHSGVYIAKREVTVGTFRSVPVHSLTRTANDEVKLGMFKSLPTRITRSAISQVSQPENRGRTEPGLEQGEAFPLSALLVQR